MKEPQGGPEEQSLAFGGQALIEGVMMRSRNHLVMCVRQPNGEIATHSQGMSSLTRRNRVLVHPPEVLRPRQVHVHLDHVLKAGVERLQRLLQSLEALPGLGLDALKLLAVRAPVSGVA